MLSKTNSNHTKPNQTIPDQSTEYRVQSVVQSDYSFSSLSEKESRERERERDFDKIKLIYVTLRVMKQ